MQDQYKGLYIDPIEAIIYLQRSHGVDGAVDANGGRYAPHKSILVAKPITRIYNQPLNIFQKRYVERTEKTIITIYK